MPKAHRLTHADFISLKRARREGGRFFVLTFTENQANKPKFACVVSKKVAPKAVERNLIRRRVMAFLRMLPFDMVPGNYIFTAKKEVKSADFEDISLDLRKMIANVSR